MELVEERSFSRSGKHAMRRLVLVVSKDGVREPEARRVRTKPLYARGEAYLLRDVSVGEGEYLVQASFVRNLRGHVKGTIEVYTGDGALVYRAVYRKLKIRRSMGDPKYAWVVQRVVEHLKLPVKRMNLGYGR